jgi:hypothetical protein|uniref:Uncharacterized protein n=1 Tax=virus sp. ctmTa7 TaxID=2828255 RepID=A0A8S5RC20_9VIRU|nr:MAG TPA: hypothetical protein [virus sp. ctmTa7]
MLAALLFGAAIVVSGVCAFKDDVSTKASSRRIDEKGNVHYYDRKGQDYINGEKVIDTWFYDKDHNFHPVKKGANTGKIYQDKYQDNMDRLARESLENKKRAIKGGYLGYVKYIPQTKCWGFAEVSTDKIIACLFGVGKVYRKFYWSGIGTCEADIVHFAKGDYGVPISKEEYENLKKNFGDTYTASWPFSDDEVSDYYMCYDHEADK